MYYSTDDDTLCAKTQSHPPLLSTTNNIGSFSNEKFRFYPNCFELCGARDDRGSSKLFATMQEGLCPLLYLDSRPHTYVKVCVYTYLLNCVYYLKI